MLAGHQSFVTLHEMASDISLQVFLGTIHTFHMGILTRLSQMLVYCTSVHPLGAPILLLRTVINFKLAVDFFVSLKFLVLDDFITPIFAVSAPELKLRKHISDDFMRFHFEIRSTFAFERTNSWLLQPLLQTIHAKAVLTLIALKWAHQNPVANPTFQLLGECLLVDDPLSFHRVLFDWGKNLILTLIVLVTLWLLSRFIHWGVSWVLRDKREVDARIVIDVD